MPYLYICTYLKTLPRESVSVKERGEKRSHQKPRRTRGARGSILKKTMHSYNLSLGYSTSVKFVCVCVFVCLCERERMDGWSGEHLPPSDALTPHHFIFSVASPVHHCGCSGNVWTETLEGGAGVPRHSLSLSLSIHTGLTKRIEKRTPLATSTSSLCRGGGAGGCIGYGVVLYIYTILSSAQSVTAAATTTALAASKFEGVQRHPTITAATRG